MSRATAALMIKIEPLIPEKIAAPEEHDEMTAQFKSAPVQLAFTVPHNWQLFSTRMDCFITTDIGPSIDIDFKLMAVLTATEKDMPAVGAKNTSSVADGILGQQADVSQSTEAAEHAGGEKFQ
jgi:hypothetical protein